MTTSLRGYLVPSSLALERSDSGGVPERVVLVLSNTESVEDDPRLLDTDAGRNLSLIHPQNILRSRCTHDPNLVK
jgi:hypothetical protein